MSAAHTIRYFEGQSFRVDPAILAGVKEKMDLLEDKNQEQDGSNQSSSRNKSSQRFFLAQAPACTRPDLSGEALADTTQMSPAQLARLTINSPTSNTQEPDELHKLALNLVAKGKDQNSGGLFEYLTALVLFQIATGKAQKDIAAMNQTFSDAAVTLMKEASLKAQADLVTFQTDQNNSANTSFWSQLLTYVGVAVGGLVMLVTGSPILLALSIIGIVTANVHTSNGQSLDQDLSDAVGSAALSIATEMCGGTPPAALVTAIKDILFGAVAIGEAVILGGVEEALENGSKIADSAVTVAEGGAEEAEEVVNVAEDSAQLAQKTVTVSDELGNTAKAVVKSVFRRRLGKLLLVTSSGGPLLPQLSQQIATAAFPNDKTAQTIFAATIQLMVGLAGSLGGSKLNGAFEGPGLASILTSQVGEQAYQRAMVAMKILQTSVNTSAAGCEFATGKTLLDESTTLNDQANVRLTMAVTQGVIDSLQTTATSEKSMFSGVYKEEAEMQDLADRLAPLDPRNYQG